MEIRQLRYFVRIVDLGSFSRAAQELYVAQPALSKQIRMLEEELGSSLLHRSVRGVEATSSGLVFYRHAQSVLRQLERVAGEIAEAHGNPRGQVTIGIPQSPAQLLAAPLVQAVHQRFPGVQLRIREGVSGTLEEQLLNARLDMSLLFDRDSRPARLHSTPLLTESLVLVTPGASRRPAASATATLKEAARHAMVLPGPENTTRQIIEAAFARAGLRLQLLAEADAVSTMKAIVRSGLGATIVSSSALAGADGLEGLAARRIVSPGLERGLSLCAADAAALSLAAQAVFDFIPSVVENMVAQGQWKGAMLARRTPGNP
jgi:LysR family transcriptional regulator, nitrogen assimilation regulatory protein